MILLKRNRETKSSKRVSRSDDIDYRDPAYIQRTLPIFQRIAKYFRTEVRGLENLPRDRAALLIGNHSGGFFIMDAFVFTAKVYERFGVDINFHQLIHEFVAWFPLYDTARKYGCLTAGRGNGENALRHGSLLLLYPGGDYESFRPSWESSKVDFGGRKGFIKLALDENVPIVPIVSIGIQETALFISRGEWLAKRLGLDKKYKLRVLPLSFGFPFGFSVLDFPPRIPLPAKLTMQVLPPIDLRARFGATPDIDVVYDTLLAEMQVTLDQLAAERRFPILG